MGPNNCIDMKIALFLKRVINFYIKKRTNAEIKKQNNIWIAKFDKKDFFVHRLSDNLYINIYRDSILSKLVYSGFEETEISFVRKYLRKGDTFFDIGANIGLFSLFASRIIGDTGTVYAFEPTPLIYERLLGNIKLNNLKNIKSINIGFSNVRALVDFNVSNDGHDAWNSLAKLNQLQNGTSIKVNVETLDSFIEESNILNINFIKLDVEGWEKFVLEGGRKLLSKKNPPVFLVEFAEDHAFAAGYYCGELYDFMKSFGFEWYSFDSKTNNLKKEDKKLHYPWENLIAIKNYEECYSRIKSDFITP